MGVLPIQNEQQYVLCLSSHGLIKLNQEIPFNIIMVFYIPDLSQEMPNIMNL